MKLRHVCLCLVASMMIISTSALAGVVATYDRVGSPWNSGGRLMQQVRITVKVTADVAVTAVVRGQYWVNTQVNGSIGPIAVSDMPKQNDGSRVLSVTVTVPKDATFDVRAGLQ
jgi:hypothetical protein